MSMQYCEFCDKTIDTDFNLEHWDEQGVCMLELEDAEKEFPIYCTDENNTHAFMIISNHRVKIVTNSPHEIGVKITDFYPTDHETYDLWKAGELTESSEKDFHFHRIEINNRMAIKQKP